LVDAMLLCGCGARVVVAGDVFVSLFAESTARAIVTCADADVDAVTSLAAGHGVPLARIGRTGGDLFAVDGQFEISLDELRATHEATLPTLFG
jgi:phosphoribosylformylglycinamidine synthase